MGKIMLTATPSSKTGLIVGHFHKYSFFTRDHLMCLIYLINSKEVGVQESSKVQCVIETMFSRLL